MIWRKETSVSSQHDGDGLTTIILDKVHAFLKDIKIAGTHAKSGSKDDKIRWNSFHSAKIFEFLVKCYGDILNRVNT